MLVQLPTKNFILIHIYGTTLEIDEQNGEIRSVKRQEYFTRKADFQRDIESI
jgi:hypothetical protein